MHDRRLSDEVMSELSYEEQIKVIQEHVHLHSDPRILILERPERGPWDNLLCFVQDI